MVSPSTGYSHLQGSPHLGLHYRDDHVHPVGDAEEDQVWLQHLPPCSGRSAAVWREDEALSQCISAPGTSPPAPDPKHFGKTRRRRSQCQLHHRQGGGTRVDAVWDGLPPASSRRSGRQNRTKTWSNSASQTIWRMQGEAIPNCSHSGATSLPVV